MNLAWKQVREASPTDVNRKTLRSRLRSEPELAPARKGVFGAWRKR